MVEYRAAIEQSPYNMNPRLHVYCPRGDNQLAILLEDGTWTTVDDGVVSPPMAGLVLPREALKAIALALTEHLGELLPSEGERRVLREWLEVERGRVDAQLASVSNEEA